MSRPASTLDEEPFVVDRPLPDKNDEAPEGDDGDDGASSSSEENEEDVSVKRRFEQIIDDLKRDKLDLRDPTTLHDFFAHNASYLGQKTGENDATTLLHLLIEDAKDKVIEKYQPLVKLLIDQYPELLKQKDGNEKNPLYIAISKKRDKLVRLMCDTHPNIDAVLNIPCFHSENCLHVAMHRNVASKLAVFLIERASEKTLTAKDQEGRTPLHIAVEYKRCTDPQLVIVKALIARCDKAMDERTKESNFSPYRYHEHTRSEAKKAANKNEKEALLGMKDDSGAVGAASPVDRDGAGTKLRTATLAKDIKPLMGHKGQSGPFLGPEFVRTGPYGRMNTSIETPSGRYGSAGGYKGSAEPPRIGLNISTDRRGSTVDAKGGNAKMTNRKKEKEEVKVTEESARAIRYHLKLYCLRTRNHDAAVDFLYGRNQDREIFFDLFDSPSLTMSEERIQEGLAHLKFEDVLQYVALPNMRVEKASVPSKFLKSPPKPNGGGRSDMVFLFNFLRNKGVKHVIRVIVDDMSDDPRKPSHSDESIEKALGGLRVEIWDWRKRDLCIETILTAAPDTREVCLYWSGSNAVLRGWSELGGLNVLKQLKKVHLYVEQGLETAKRTQNNISQFCKRLKDLREDIEIIEEYQQKKHDPAGGTVDTTHGPGAEHRHKWLTCMDEFADFIQNIQSPIPMQEPVTIALIDDGVDINEQSIHNKIIGGRSFCQREEDQNLSKPYYVTSGGHGTVTASLISRVFPLAQLYVVKLEEHMSVDQTRQITARSAAKAVRAARDRKVHIICMAWTIEKTKDNESDIRDLEAEIEAAAKEDILMFCAAIDQGFVRDNSYPAACGGTKHIFKIGAAEASGQAWVWTGGVSNVDFIFPGHNVIKERPRDVPWDKCETLSGSSVATAIAAGLAGLMLYCVQFGALNKPPGDNKVTMEDFGAVRRHQRMKEAFLGIGTSKGSDNKYIEVWRTFEPAAKKGEGETKEKKLEIVVDLAKWLMTGEIFK